MTCNSTENGPTAELVQVYDLSLSARVTWQAHSLSNAGTNGSNRIMPRRQLLADGTEVDACSGNIAKHYHAMLLAEYLEAAGVPLCPACVQRDARRAAALAERQDYIGVTMERLLLECGLCDIHGFLVTARNASPDGSSEARQKLAKNSLVDFSFALSIPGSFAESLHLATRSGTSKDDGQMLMKRPVRSGQYALAVRYGAVGIGVDTYRWDVAITDAEERLRRHRAVLSALCDQLLSPDGAMTATQLPHLSGLEGAVSVRVNAGRAPLYSGLQEDFVTQLVSMSGDNCRVFPFHTVVEFSNVMSRLIKHSVPALPVERIKVDAVKSVM
jgi:CRISPR-associated protein Cst2